MNIQSGKSKWKRGLNKLRRQSTVSEHSPEFQSIMEEDEDNSEQEMQNYLSNLKKKTGLNMLWSGRKFNETIDRDPEIDISEPVSLIRSTLKDMTLDSDEEDLHKYIQNLTDDEQDVVSEKPSERSSDGELDLMKNINFAEIAVGEFKLQSDDDNDDNSDYMPRIVKPKFEEELSSTQDDSMSSGGGVFKGNIRFIDSDEVSSEGSDQGIQSVMHKTVSEAVDEEEFEEEIEDYVESRAKSPAKSTDYNYTDSRFESFDTENYDRSRDVSIKSRTSKSGDDSTMTETDSSITRSVISVRLSPYMKQGKVRKPEKPRRKKGGLSLNDSASSSSKSTSSRSAPLSKTSKSDRSSSNRHFSSSDRKQKRAKDSKKRAKDSKKKNQSTQTTAKTQTEPNLLTDNALLRNDIMYRYLDPSPIATTVVDKDALEAVTSYNPSVVALNDLLKYQIQLTKQYIDNSWRLYKAYSEPGTSGKYKYTTLKDTMKYMKKNAPSVISYEQALKQIKSEEI